MTCPICLRPIATDEDERTWQAVGLDEMERPDDWKNDDADHLCWREYGGECEPPDWFAAVTPLEVQTLREDVPILRAQLADAERYVAALQSRLAELTNGDPDPVMVEMSATKARLRFKIAEMTPRWREGEPPAGSWVWRENEPFPVYTLTEADHHDFANPDNPDNARLYWIGDGAYPWGTARWCPIPKPEEP